ncbi:MAG: hypothetical protein JXX28_02335 [Deltaproteobacteria bacterium]|nr:hypothetical protein [Deltaproteobacteria bacterium]
MLLLLIGLGTALAEHTPLSYVERLEGVSWRRGVMARALADAGTPEERAAVVGQASSLLGRILVDELIPAWEGTAWSYAGTTRAPGQGSIACGYLVSTVLRDAGLGVEWARLAQQPSEYIVRTLVPADHIWRFRDRPVPQILDRVAAEGDGLYVVGLDTHVGLLAVRDGQVEMCHSSMTAPREVRCEPAEGAWAFTHSRYHVLGQVLNPALVQRWLEDAPIPTVAWKPPVGWRPRAPGE